MFVQDQEFDGGLVHILNSYLLPPASLHATLDRAWIDEPSSIFEEALHLTGLMSEIEALGDVTVFAPSNDALYEVGSIFNGMSKDELKALVSYHVIIGNTTYSGAIGSEPSNWTWDAQTLAKKELKVRFIGTSLYADSAYAFGDFMIANGNAFSIGQFLDPNHTTESRFPGATRVTRGAPLFTNIVGVNNNSTNSSSLFPSSTASLSLPSDTTSLALGSNTLSKGAIAGIGVSVTICVLSLVPLGVWLIYRARRKAAKAHEEAKRKGGSSVEGKAELEGTTIRHELLGDYHEEADGTAIGPELPGSERLEAEGTTVGPELPATPCAEADSKAIKPDVGSERIHELEGSLGNRGHDEGKSDPNIS